MAVNRSRKDSLWKGNRLKAAQQNIKRTLSKSGRTRQAGGKRVKIRIQWAAGEEVLRRQHGEKLGVNRRFPSAAAGHCLLFFPSCCAELCIGPVHASSSPITQLYRTPAKQVCVCALLTHTHTEPAQIKWAESEVFLDYSACIKHGGYTLIRLRSSACFQL